MGSVGGIVFDANGVAVPPQLPYTSLEAWSSAFSREWASIEAMAASLATAPRAEGLPDQAPSPNTVYQDERGQLYRFVIDPDVTRRPFVQDDMVHESVQMRKQYVALSLDAARAATDNRNAEAGEPETDFWCGFTWLRGGYSPERWAPVEVQRSAVHGGGPALVFTQPASPTDAARIRHEVANMDRRAPTLPIETAPKAKRGRPAKPTDDTDHDAALAAALED